MYKGISQRAYARRLGVSHTAVQKAIKDGRISTNYFGRIDPVRADIDWLFYANMTQSQVPEKAWNKMADSFKAYGNDPRLMKRDEFLPDYAVVKDDDDEDYADEF